MDENLDLAKLQRFPVVMLCNTAVISEAELQLLRDYVSGGGQLLVTGHSGLFDMAGQLQPESTLHELVGAHARRVLDSLDNHVRWSPAGSYEPASVDVQSLAQLLTRDTAADWPFLVKGPAVVYEPTTATAVGQLLRPHRTLRQQQGQESTESPLSADQVAGPARIGQSRRSRHGADAGLRTGFRDGQRTLDCRGAPVAG